MRAAFFDIDGTLTNDRTWKGFLDYFQTHNLRRATHVVFLGIHYPLYFLYRLGLASADQARGFWASHMAWYVRDYSIEEGQKVWDWTVERFLNRHWRADTRALLDEHRQAGEPVILVSSGLQPLVQRIALELGIEHAVGTYLETKNGRYTGRSLSPICIGEYKASLAQEYLRAQGINIDLEQSCAYADSISDLGLLNMVGQPTAVYPEPALRKVAEERGWRIFPG